MAYADELIKLVSEIPEWQNDEVREQEIGELREFLKSERNYSDSDIANVVTARATIDHRNDYKQSIANASQAKEDALQKRLDNPKLSGKAKIDILLEDGWDEPAPSQSSSLRERLKMGRNPSHNHPDRSESDRSRAINKILKR